MGVQEMSAVKVRVFRKSGDTLTFGVYPGRADHPMDGESAPLLTVQVSRQIGRAGVAAFALPGLNELHTGRPWGELISLGDYVQVDATVQRAPGPQENDKGFSHSWRTIFFGRVLDMDDASFPENGGFVYTTMVTCDDFLGSLESPQFSYWRELGSSFGLNGDSRDKLNRLQKLNLGETDLSAASTSVAAEIILTAFIEGRMDIERKIGDKEVAVKDTYGYRFEGDDLATMQELKQLAPQAQTWKQALELTVDGPHFYELFQDSLPHGAESRTLAETNSGEIGRSKASQLRKRAPAYRGEGGYGEMIVVRPAPFPTYRDEIDAAGNPTGKTYYTEAAWNSLPLIEAAPFAHSNLRLNKSRKELYSVFSVNLARTSFGGANDNTQANSGMQIIGDIEKLLKVTGYVPLDVVTKRNAIRTLGSDAPEINLVQFPRTLGWQLFSFNHLNDIYQSGTSEVPLDLRMQLGARWRENDYLFYIEGYKHVFSLDSASSSLTLSRGLPVEYYGLEPKGRPKMADKMDYVKKYLGRQRPGEEHAPRAGRGIMDATSDDQAAEG